MARLKANHDRTLVIFGSGVLVRSLMQRQLVDGMLLMIHPLVLGQGHRLFDGAALARFKLRSAEASDAGVMVVEYAVAPG